MELAKRDGYTFVWIDTICIDKTSSTELQEAINSMYRWYKESSVCYAYLEDVNMARLYGENHGQDSDGMGIDIKTGWAECLAKAAGPDERMEQLKKAIRSSRWFTRGWTLQELIAPCVVKFYDTEWCLLGMKHNEDPDTGDPESFVHLVHDITNVPGLVLRDQKRLPSYSVAQRMSWAANRQTTRAEDRAYCLMGLFDIHMPMLYGEGDAAFGRLREEIMKRSDDQSLLADGYISAPALWSEYDETATLSRYKYCSNIRPTAVWMEDAVRKDKYSTQYKSYVAMEKRVRLPSRMPTLDAGMDHYLMTNRGLLIELDVIKVRNLPGMIVARLKCDIKEQPSQVYGDSRVIVLCLTLLTEGAGSWVVHRLPNLPLVDLPDILFYGMRSTPRRMYITDRAPSDYAPNSLRTSIIVTLYNPGLSISEVYPAPLYAPHRYVGRIPLSTEYTLNGTPENIYLRMQSTEHGLDFCVKLSAKWSRSYGTFKHPMYSVSRMPSSWWLLELLLYDKYPPPDGEPVEVRPEDDYYKTWRSRKDWRDFEKATVLKNAHAHGPDVHINAFIATGHTFINVDLK